MAPRRSLVALAALLVLSPLAARADEERDAARALADKANELFEAGRYEESIRYFEKAEAVFHAPTLLLRLARAHVKVGKLVAARGEYQRIVGEQLAPKAPREFTEARAAAAVELADLDRRLPKLTVIVRDAPAEGLAVTVDAASVPLDEIGGPRPCDPGPHTVAVSAPRVATETRTVTCREGASARVEIALPAAPPLATGPVSGPLAPEPSRGGFAPALVAFGLGAIGLGVGSVAGVAAIGKADALKRRCPDPACDPGGKPLADSAHALATVSTIGFIAAGVFAGAGLVLLVVRPGRGPARSGASPALSASLGIGNARAEATF